MGRFPAAIKDAIAAAENELVGQLIRQSNPGRKIVGVGRNESREPLRRMGSSVARVASMGVLSAGNDQRLRAEIEVGGVVIGLFDGSKDFVAQAEVQGEAWTHFEVVESINGVNLPVIDGVGVTLVMVPPSGMPSRKVAIDSPSPSPGPAGLSVKSLPKLMVPRGEAGSRIVNCSKRSSLPNFRAWRPRTQLRLSVKTKLCCFSMAGRNPELPTAACHR